MLSFALLNRLLHININIFICVIHQDIYAIEMRVRLFLDRGGRNIMFQLGISLLLRHLIAWVTIIVELIYFLPTFLCFPTVENYSKYQETRHSWARRGCKSENYKFMLNSHAQISPVITILKSRLRNIICLFNDLFTVKHEFWHYL